MKIRGMTEKYILREAVRDVITDTVYRRQKHPFLSPPATLNPAGDLHALMQDTLRGPAGGDVPFLDQERVIGLLDSVGGANLDFGDRVVLDQVLTLALQLRLPERGARPAGLRRGILTGRPRQHVPAPMKSLRLLVLLGLAIAPARALPAQQLRVPHRPLDPRLARQPSRGGSCGRARQGRAGSRPLAPA